MRTIIAGIDVKNPTQATVDTVQIHTVATSDVIARVRPIYPGTRFISAPNKTIIIVANPNDMAQIKSIITTIDTPAATPTPRPFYPAEAVRVTQREARDIGRSVAHSVPRVRVSLSGSELLLSGPPDAVSSAKVLIAQLDQPQGTTQYTQLYRLRYVDAGSVADLLSRSFHGLSIQVDKELNSITVQSSAAIQRRIADAIAQLDAAPPSAGGANPSTGGYSGADAEVVSLRAAIPGLNGSPSTSAADIATTVSQALAGAAPDLKLIVPPNSTQVVITGSPYAISLAKDLIYKLDVVQPLVVLDTEVLEVDETYAKDLGLQLPQGGAILSTQFTEQAPSVPAGGGIPPPLGAIQPFARTPLQFSVQLNLLIQQNKARVLADPRITTISGRTASIRAGDTISVLTSTGGGPGTVATTQIQQFQTGVTLDITPVVNANHFISVTLHPTVNSLSGVLNGVPQIATRDTQTTVGLMDDQTLIIGGLIQESSSRTENRVPLLGDLPLIGKMFRASDVNSTRNELIITVTPHIVQPGEPNIMPGPPLPRIPTPAPLPTLPPGVKLPGEQSAVRESATKIATLLSTRQRAESEPTPPSTPAPLPMPTAFTQTNVFTYGAAPPNNFAGANQSPQIYFIQAQPTVVRSGQQVTISAVTTTNVDRLIFGRTSAEAIGRFNKIGPGKWQASFSFNTAGFNVTSGNVQMILTATTAQGAIVSVPVPFSILDQ